MPHLGFYALILGSSPHPSTPDEDDSQTELLIAEEKLSPEDEGQVMPRYENYPKDVQSNRHNTILCLCFIYNSDYIYYSC